MRVAVQSAARSALIGLKLEADRCELDAASLESFSSLVYVHLLFDVFTHSGAKKSMPAGTEGLGGGGEGGVGGGGGGGG